MTLRNTLCDPKWIGLFGVCMSAVLVLAACGTKTPNGTGAGKPPETEPAKKDEQTAKKDDGAGKQNGSPVCFTCGLVEPCFGPDVPGDALISNQTDADCFAWAEFIALNWPTEDGAGFGDPDDLNPVQWQTYMAFELLMQPGGAKPPPWGTQPTVPPDCLTEAGVTEADAKGLKLLGATSKFTASPSVDVLDGIDEAAPSDGPNWLGAQNGTNAWFEVRVNKDEYDYITADEHKFYNADNQATWVQAGKSIDLPEGTKTGRTGAIELKAAWLEVTDPKNEKWKRYKLSSAVVMDPTTQKCRATKVALVGLHILHKTASQPTWIWATFEHVDNVPGPNTKGPYNFNNPNSQPQQVENAPTAEGCKDPKTVTVSSTPNTSPPYYLCPGGPGPVPIQVTREVAIPDGAQQVNATAHAAIKENYPNSVFQYYQLINVIWSTNPSSTPTKPTDVPRRLTSMQPTVDVANTTLETYAQNLTCTDCHQYATIAPSSKIPNPEISSDFSFVIGAAKAPAADN